MRTVLMTGAAAVIAASSLTTPARANACPKEHQLTEPRTLEKVKGKAVKVTVLEQIELGGWRDMQPFRLRMRHFVIQPGGRVPIHKHDDRPSIIYFISGTATEHNAFCAEPIVHQAGTSTGEFGPGIVHWWSNDGDVPAVLVSADVIPSKK